jgi:hypothetical protein
MSSSFSRPIQAGFICISEDSTLAQDPHAAGGKSLMERPFDGCPPPVVRRDMFSPCCSAYYPIDLYQHSQAQVGESFVGP